MTVHQPGDPIPEDAVRLDDAAALFATTRAELADACSAHGVDLYWVGAGALHMYASAAELAKLAVKLSKGELP